MPRIVLVLNLFLRSSRTQRKRAALTVAAIAWGTLSLLLLLAFGEGLKRQLVRGSAGMGVDLAVLWPGETTRPWQGLPAGRPIRFQVEDIALVRARVPGLAGVSGERTNWRTAYTYGKKTVNGQLVGASLAYGELRNHIPQTGGRFLDPGDEQLRRRVVFLGNELAENLFGKEQPVGRMLRLNEVPYTVVGVMQKKRQNGSYGGPDANHAVIPLATYLAQFGGERLSNLVIRPERPEGMAAALSAVRRLLGDKYGFDPQDERAIGVWDTVKSSAIMRNVLFGIQLFLGIIGGLTLLVGGIGVANIMYAVVKERTREIGVKMALGARASWVTGPIVLEGLSYTLLGGLIGLVMAGVTIGALRMIPIEGNEALELLARPTLSPEIGALSAAVLGGIGLLAGYFPARRAAAIDPAQSLRYE
ncbi:MAG TPA: ABC transporter permease [Candidatus Polarisedimenticolaceae bacterium]|nr:ABC transporter permease [Candidatus Polarisedimenticolaceae bacterium]